MPAKNEKQSWSKIVPDVRIRPTISLMKQQKETYAKWLSVIQFFYPKLLSESREEREGTRRDERKELGYDK